MHTFREIISKWPSVAAMGADAGVGERTAVSWWQRRSIPADRFAALVRAAKLRGYSEVTAESLAAAAELRRLERDGTSEGRAA